MAQHEETDRLDPQDGLVTYVLLGVKVPCDGGCACGRCILRYSKNPPVLELEEDDIAGFRVFSSFASFLDHPTDIPEEDEMKKKDGGEGGMRWKV